jgi:hypothetical protein
MWSAGWLVTESVEHSSASVADSFSADGLFSVVQEAEVCNIGTLILALGQMNLFHSLVW